MEKRISKKEAKKIYSDNNKRVIDETVNGFVVLKNIGKVYDNRVQAVYNFNLSIQRNEFIVLVGPSGCGKSTTLQMIAGLEEISDGYLYIDRIMANYLESKDRDIAMVFQSYALYPNMTVYDNIGFGLQVRGVAKDEIKRKVFEAAEILDLGPYLDRRPKELSGGQMQRVALGRAIVRDAKLFLMDEPLSNLDAKLRVQMRSEIVKLHKNIHATTIYVTHDQTEAMTMADRIVIMNKGIVQQVGTPVEIYNNPKNVFVATFIGNPPMNVFNGEISGGTLKTEGGAITLPKGSQEAYARFIAGRRTFFADLKEKSDFTQEKTLRNDIRRLLSKIKKLSDTELIEKAADIAARLKNLSAVKGFVNFSETEAEALAKAAKNRDAGEMKANLLAADEQLKNTDLIFDGILKETDSAGMSVKKDDGPPPEKKKKAEKKKSAEENMERENAEKLNRYLSAYNAEDADKKAIIGIRPENIHLYDGFNGNKSEPIAIDADFVELLGSEYCVHLQLFGSRLIMKTSVNDIVRTGDSLRICFDMDKLKIFDAISGVCIS